MAWAPVLFLSPPYSVVSIKSHQPCKASWVRTDEWKGYKRWYVRPFPTSKTLWFQTSQGCLSREWHESSRRSTVASAFLRSEQCCRSCKSQRSKGITDALGDRQSREEVAYYPAVCTLKPFFSSLGKEWRKEWSPRSSLQGRILDPREPGMILQETSSWNLGCPDWGPTEEKKAKTLEEDIIGAGDTTWKRQDTRSQ